MTSSKELEQARSRLEVLHADTEYEEGRLHRRVSPQESAAIGLLLEELHRLHIAVSIQRNTLLDIADRKKKASAKPPDARSRKPTARRKAEKS
jgi:hypothetical protein